ncbi:MAG: membrane-associated phospholipid phosphatase [bacterium]|jgi:membrane-associated phospholipid phosphatase
MSISKFKIWKPFPLLVISFLILMGGISIYDYEWTYFLWKHSWPSFARFMDQSVFQGKAFGGTDSIIFIFIGVLFSYFWFNRTNATPLQIRFRPIIGYLFLSASTAGLAIVHSLKWSIGRARPYLVFDQKFEFSSWFSFGGHYITQGKYSGSFPSGHTATAVMLLTLAYALIGNPKSSQKTKYLGYLVGFVSLLFGILMAISRSMANRHWISDGVGSIGLVWITLHLLFYLVLKIPQQIEDLELLQKDAPAFWEGKLCFFGFLCTLGIVSFLFGIRSFFFQSPPYLFSLCFLGIFLCFIGYKKLVVYLPSHWMKSKKLY